MNRKAEREFTFKLLFMSDFYEKKELGDELLLYFDAPSPFEDKEDNDAPAERLYSLKESVNEEDRRRIVARYVDIIDKLDDIDKRISEVSKGWTIDRIGKVDKGSDSLWRKGDGLCHVRRPSRCSYRIQDCR